MHIDNRWNTTKLSYERAILLTLTVDCCRVAHLGKKTIFSTRMLKEGETLRISADRESLEILRDDTSHVFMINQLRYGALMRGSCCLEMCDGPVAVK